MLAFFFFSNCHWLLAQSYKLVKISRKHTSSLQYILALKVPAAPYNPSRILGANILRNTNPYVFIPRMPLEKWLQTSLAIAGPTAKETIRAVWGLGVSCFSRTTGLLATTHFQEYKVNACGTIKKNFNDKVMLIPFITRLCHERESCSFFLTWILA